MKKRYTSLSTLACLMLLANFLAGQNLQINLQVSHESCNGACNGKIATTVTGGGPPSAFAWSNGATTQDISGLCAGIYTVTVTSANGIAQTASATVLVQPGMELTTCVTDVSCYGFYDGQVDLSVSGGTGAYTYLWSNGLTSQDINNTPQVDVMVTVTDAFGCTATTSATVGGPSPITIASSVTNSSPMNANGSVDLTVTGGTPPYSYLWSNGVSSPDLSGLPPGTYSVTITDANGCTTTQSFTVLGDGNSGSSPILLNASVTNVSCAAAPDCSGSIILTVTGGAGTNYSYLWAGPGGYSSTQSGVFNVCVGGTYCVTVTSFQGTVAATACYTIGQDQGVVVDIQSSNAAFCNYDNGNNPVICEKVCPHTAVTYFFDPPANCGQPLPIQGGLWTITGAESYSVKPNGREVLVQWGEAGPGLVTLSSQDPSVCFNSSRCVTIVEEPVAKFKTDPPVLPNTTLQLCKGQTVSFVNESLNAEQYEWFFSDNLLTVSDENPEHTFLIPGNFTVSLIARSNCLCADTTLLQVEVLDSEPPLLDCVGSVCPGEIVKYSTSSNCSSYAWLVSPNGTIVDGGGPNDNSITVEWGQGPKGTISLSAMGCAGAACPQASIFSIPIISDNAEIRGDESVCPGSEEDYSIDLFDGTGYTWTLSSGGSILRGQGTNKVSVTWTAPANANTTHWLSVEYNNCYLGCGGRDSIPVKILPPFYIQGKVEICEAAPAIFNGRIVNSAQTVSSDWIIYRQDGTVFWTSGSASNSINFPANAPPGKYRIVAVPAIAGLTCSSSAELVLSIIAKPPKPAVIAGPSLICPGSPLTYELLGNAPYSVQWTISNGTPNPQTGNPINVNWLGTSGWLSANYVSNDGLGCKSDTTQLNIASISTMSITGVPAVCKGTVGFYSADAFSGFDYQWEIVPADAGAIKSGQGSNALEVFWQQAGNHKLRVSTCGNMIDFDVTVWANPAPAVNAPVGLCQGDSILVSTTAPFSSYSWQSAAGANLSNAASVQIPIGAYLIEVIDGNGCKGSSDFLVDPYPNPNVSLSTADPTGFCNNSMFVSMTALVPNTGTFTFQWLHDGVPVGGNSPVYASNQYGLYTVIATNEYGCSATSAPLLLYNYCGGGGGYGGGPPGGGVPACPPGSIEIVLDPSMRCDSIALMLNDLSGQYVPGSAGWWTGISGGGSVGTATGDLVSFVYPNAGKYIILVRVLLQSGAICEAVDSVNIEAVAQFSQRQACPGDSTAFTDESTRLPAADISAWAWDFGEAGTSDTSSLESPGYPFSSTGNYSATLTITTATGCTSTYSENVFVPDVPAPAFTPPLANCTGNATPFTLANPAGIIETSWEFGDPASGNLNQSNGDPVFHNYAPAGNYTVSITATNAYGCTASATQMVNIVNNPFSGIITPFNPVICEGKTVTLIAPSGPSANYVWSNGTNLQTLVVGQEGVYDVTLTNGNGCSYSPPNMTVDVIPAPVGVIKALEVNELGQVIGVAYPTLSVCAGEDVNLQIQGNGSYSYQWSGGNGSDEILIFSEDRDNLLAVGTHTFTVTVTDQISGCTAVLPPFEVTVNPVPAGFNLATDDVCAGTPSTISYTGPQPPEWQIFWNTGETGPSMTTDDPGLYFVRVINEFGCSAQSNTVVIFPGPNVAALPSGCHERCNPDTLCLPALPDIVSWQWYFEGTPIPGATSNQFVATLSGSYSAELLDNNGCQAQSADLSLELYDGFGDILGHVWSDVNNNGIIDAADTLVALIPVQLWQNGTQVNSDTSGTNGSFDWSNVFASDYLVQIDTQALSPLWEVVIFSDSVSLTGCGGKVFAELLVDAYVCPPIFSSISMSACPGSAATYNGTQVLAGQSQDFTFASYLGCDSIVTLTVLALPSSASTLDVSACPGSTYSYQGVDVAVGQSQDFTLTNYLGCDSIVTVTVSALPTSASTLNASACPGSTYTYQGVDLAVGESQDFTLTNYLGCDSIVTVTVSALPTSASTLNASACPGLVYTYQGVDLAVGQSQDFTLTNYLGCDSIVTVTVSALPTSASTLNASACPGSVYTYQGVDLAVGQSQDFTLANYLGCDSIVTVTVSALPTSASTLNASACPGSTYTYQGVDLAAGQSQDFALTNYLGCDSIVTVVVSALPTSTGSATFGVCPNETYNYQGQALSAGTVQDFILPNYLGCDSIVTVTIYEKVSSAEIREVKVCPGEEYVFNGITLAIGEEQDIHFTNGEGCDSLITIRVSAWPELEFTVAAQNSCPNTGNGALSVTVLPGGSLPTGYALDGGTFQTDPRFDALAAGDYTISVQDENGCVFEAPAAILASPNLEVLLPDALVIPCDSIQITLTPIISGDTNALQLIWWNGAQTPTTSTAEAGQIWLDASNHCGESLHREAEVNWADIHGEPINIYVPNIFSPSSKNLENNMFRPYFGDNLNLLDYRLEVYDRWGNMLFETEQPELGWTGDFRASIMDPGVYVWQMWVKVAFCGRALELYKKGDVTVER